VVVICLAHCDSSLLFLGCRLRSHGRMLYSCLVLCCEVC
jgi:hypothetical protein